MPIFSTCKSYYTACLLTLLLALGACSQEKLPEGLVATVNGKPIYLKTLQAVQDTRAVSLGANQRPALESLKKQYGAALSALIINALVIQELERLELAVSDEAVQASEAEVRADYSEAEFEKTLTEEYIDIQVWRELLRQQLSILAFQDKVLRPQLVVKLEEAEAYYKEHKAEFTVPASLTLVQVSGASKELVEQAHAQAPNLQGLHLPDVTVQRFTIRRQSVPLEWQKEVQALGLNKSTPVINRDGFYQFVCLVASHPARELSLRDAYPLLNDVLLEDKIDESFATWLEQAVQKARIQVAAPLHLELANTPTAKTKNAENPPAGQAPAASAE